MFPDMFGTTDLLQKGISAAQLRHDTIANNIANIDTPGFKASGVEFESYMKDALDAENGSGFQANTAGPGHISFDSDAVADVQPQVVQDNSTTMRMDGNNVDIDAQMSALAKNNIWYNTLIAKLNSEFTRLKLAIDGR